MEEVIDLSPMTLKVEELIIEDNELDNCSETSIGMEVHNQEHIIEDITNEDTLTCDTENDSDNSYKLCDVKILSTEEGEDSQSEGTMGIQYINSTDASPAALDTISIRSADIEIDDNSEIEELNKETHNNNQSEIVLLDDDVITVSTEDNSEDIIALDDDDSFKENDTNIDNNDVQLIEENEDDKNGEKPEYLILEGENGKLQSAEVIIENNIKIPVPEETVPLRRSSRTIKRKQYGDNFVTGNDASKKVKHTEEDLTHNFLPVVSDPKSLVPEANQKKETTNNSNSLKQSTQQILPSLSDDMFVVEAPSFIVPYVYEKPSFEPFRDFLEWFGKFVEEEKSMEENSGVYTERVEVNKGGKTKVKKKADKAKKEADKEELKVKDAVKEHKEEKKKSKEGKEAEKKKRGNDDDASWGGEILLESDDEVGSNNEEKTVVIKEKADLSDELKDVDKVVCEKADNYFDCSLGKFFMNIGLNLVQEFVQNDLLKQQKRKLSREKRAGHKTRATETSIASLMKNLEISQAKNSPFRYKQNKCEFCTFKSDSMLVMLHHLETPHMKNSMYKCNYCTFEIRSPHDILYHMEAEHNVHGKLERAPAHHQCANCPFEDNGKGKLARHLMPCSRKFKPETNLAPPSEWEPPAKIPKLTRSRNNMMGIYHTSFNRGGTGAAGRGRSPVLPAPDLRGGAMIRQSTPALLPTNFAANNNGGKCMQQPSISITPLPRQPLPEQPQPAHQNKGSFVVCEICDGYIKDLEQLRNHMQWIHKVKIHPKMIYNRPPLNCQKCHCRFFTDQGLERHLLGSHGLVTSSMQEAANNGKDAGRCPVCGRVYQWKLLNHVAGDHNLALKPAHLSYKCTVCTATFGMYKQFESHVYSAHSVVAKRIMDKSKIPPTKPTNDTLLKPLKIDDDISIIPQSTKPATAAKQK
ncbi:MOG interacting and ectopic P-granules protein 1 [Papilio xuthus]|nr:MOG interacting and ectopic P-granules protein 1 [Papilio xuthus]